MLKTSIITRSSIKLASKLFKTNSNKFVKSDSNGRANKMIQNLAKSKKLKKSYKNN